MKCLRFLVVDKVAVTISVIMAMATGAICAPITDSLWTKTGSYDIYNKYYSNGGRVSIGTNNIAAAGVRLMVNGAAAIGYSTAGQTVPANGLAIAGQAGIGTTAPYTGCGLEIMNSYPGVLDSCPLIVHNNSSTNGTAVAIGFEAVSGNAITGKIANVRVASGDYRTDFYNYSSNSLQRAMSIYQNKVCIGTTNPGTYLLAVKGKIGAQEVVVTMTGWSDFVFNDDYNLKPLEKVAEYVKTNKHLEGIPTQAEVKKNGVSIGEMQAKLLQKVEELTLYTIAMKKENDELRTKVEVLEKKVGR